MIPDFTEIAREAIYLTLWISAPILVGGVVVATIIGGLQTTTRIQDSALAFVPKLIAVALILVAFGAAMGNSIQAFATDVWTSIAEISR